MSKDQRDHYLKFGQGIIIEGFKTDGLDQGFLTAKGFADVKAKYQTYQDILYFKNYRNTLFQILPAGNFELNDELEKNLIENQGQPDTPNITILKLRAESEKVQFQLNIANKMKEKVCFGHSVIFKHIDSESYISGTIKPSDGSNGAFIVQVTEKLSQSLVFKLEPFRSFEFSDMAIPFDSPIKIKNQYNNGYLTFQKMGIQDDHNKRTTYIEKKPIESNNSYHIPKKTQSAQSEIYQIVTHFVDLSCDKQVPMPWRFKLHVNQVINDTLIQHDIVYLKHTQNNGVLATYKGEIVLKEQKEQVSDDLCFYECLWEIEKHNATEHSYILRHLMSGMTFGVEEVQEGEVTYLQPVLIDISLGKRQHFQLGYVDIRLAKKEGGGINSDSYVNLAWGDCLLEIDQQASGLDQSVVRKSRMEPESNLVDLIKMSSLYKKNIDYDVKRMNFRKNQSQEHCFVIKEIEDDLKKELLFALSFHSVIIKLKEDLQWGAIEAAKKIDYLRMMQVTTKIKEIKIFVKNCSEEEAQLEHNLPLVKRQMICKDLGISQLLFQLLYYMKMNLKEDIYSDKHNEREKFLELYNSIYEVIKELIRNNTQFKMHVSKWFHFIIEDIIHNQEPSQLALLQELLTHNQFFVNNFITPELVNHLTLSSLAKNHHTDFIEKKYLQIFRLFCIVGTKVNTANQQLILNSFVKYLKEEKSIFDINILSENGSISVKCTLDKVNVSNLPLKELHEEYIQRRSDAWLYFVEYLNLIADLVQGRNKITEIELTKYYSLQILRDLVEAETLNQAQVPIIRLIHYLYAENEYFYPIQRRRIILDFHKLSEEKHILSTKSEIKPWDPPFGRVLIRLKEKLKQYGPINPEQVPTNMALFAMLKFLWETLSLGFWQDKEEVKEILNDVLHTLSKHESITNYETATILSEKNILMINCKMECLKIVELITDIDNDMFVQIIAAKFKDFQIPKKKFNLKGAFSQNSLFEIKGNQQLVDRFLKDIPSEVQLQPIVETNICDLMIELSNYKNPALTSKAIEIVNRVVQTRKKAFSQFYELIIISEDERIKLFQFMELHRNKFFILEDQNIVNVTTDNQQSQYFMVFDQKDYGIMQVLYLLTELMKNENSILDVAGIRSIHQSGIFEALGSNSLINFTGERTSTNRMKQEIVYSSNLHLKVLNYIFNSPDVPETDLSRKLLHLCYFFIVSLIQNFNQIKAIMQWHVPKIIRHIKINVGCIDFLKEMYDNNKTMLYNQLVVFDLIKEICEDIEAEEEGSYYKSKLLDFFRFLIYCNGRSLKTNQIQILKIMQDDSFHNIMIKITQEEVQQLIRQYGESGVENDTVQMSAKLTYICTFFQAMSSLIDNNNDVNIGKLIRRYSFDHLVKLLKAADKCWVLKRNIRSFLNRLYYFRPHLGAYLKTILDDQLDNILQDLNLFIEAKFDKNLPQKINQKFANPVRFTYLESYHYLLFQESLFTLFELFTRQQIVLELSIYFNRQRQYEEATLDDYKIIKIVERLVWLQKYFKDTGNTYTNSLIKFLIFKSKDLFKKITSPILWKQAMPLPIKSLDKENEAFKRERQNVQSKIYSGLIGHFFEQRNPSIVRDLLPLSFQIEKVEKKPKPAKSTDPTRLKEILRDIFMREKHDYQNEDQRISHELQQTISSLKLSGTATKYFSEQAKSKIETYMSRDDIYEYIQRIIEMNSIDSVALDPALKMFFLHLMTGLIKRANAMGPASEPVVEEVHEIQPQNEAGHEEIPQNSAEKPSEQEEKEIDNWDPEDWSNNQGVIEETQIKLKKCGLGKFIVSIMKEDIISNIELADSALLCAISYLMGGNRITQNNIIEELNQDSDNKVLENIEALIVKLGKLIRKNIDQCITKEEEITNNFNITTIDNYDFYDLNMQYALRKNVFEPNSTDEYLYSKLCITTYRRVFKFLQLLCENDNQENKHFIREQSTKSKQFNFINIATKQLRDLFQIYCSQIREVPMFLLEFILEVTQIPIKENQIALMNSTFFEDLCQMNNFFTSQKKFEERHFTDFSDLQEIYFKSFEIILSNFEGNSDKTFLLLDAKLDPRFLPNILKNKLDSMKIKDQAQLITYINNYSDEVDQENHKKTDFDENIINILNIVIIIMKIKNYFDRASEEAKMKVNSRIINNFEKFKKEVEQNHREQLKNRLADEGLAEEEAESQVEEQMKNYKCMYTYLETLLLKIQINDGQNKEQMIYFPKYPVFASLSGNLKDIIMAAVERGSHRDKIVSLLSYSKAVKEKINYSFDLQKIEKISEANMKNSFTWASNFSILICIYLGFFYHIIIEYGSAQYISYFAVGSIRFCLSLIQLTIIIFYIYYWYRLRIWLAPEPQSNQKEKVEEGTEETQAEVADEVEQVADDSAFGKAKAKVFHYISILNSIYNLIKDKINELGSLDIVKSGQFYRCIILFLTSVVGTLFYPPAYFLYLIDRMAQIEKLGAILYSIVHSFKALMWVSIMGVFFTFIFCTVTFSNYMKNVYAEGESIDQMCNSVLSCVMSLYVSGVITQTMDKFEMMRFIYDMIYITFFGLLFGNIVSGLMLDAFGSLREEADALDDDKKNTCYICNIPRETIEKEGKKFSDHIKNKHFLWNYIYYIYVLERKNPTEFTGLQYQISTKYQQSNEEMDPSWIPSKGKSEFELCEEASGLNEELTEELALSSERRASLEENINEFNKIAKEYIQ